MNRRSFLASLATLATAAAVDPEFLKWEPGVKAFFDLGRYGAVDRLAAISSNGWMHGQARLRPGDILTFEGRYEINPPGRLQEYRVSAVVSPTELRIVPVPLPRSAGRRASRWRA